MSNANLARTPRTSASRNAGRNPETPLARFERRVAANRLANALVSRRGVLVVDYGEAFAICRVWDPQLFDDTLTALVERRGWQRIDERSAHRLTELAA